MATYDAVTDRDKVQAGETPPGGLIPEDAAGEIIKHATEASAIMGVSRRIPNGGRGQTRLPVVQSLPHAYFVSGDTGFKQTTEAEWRDVFLNYEELAVIAPVPDSVINDSAFDIWGELRDPIAESIGQKIDQAVLYGNAAPTAWPDDIMTKVTDAGHVVEHDTDLFDELMGEDGVLAKVEEDGYMVSGHLAALKLRGKLRGLVDTNGQPLFKPTYQEGIQGGSRYELDGEPLTFPRNGGIDPDEAWLISGDWSQLVFSVRQDMDWTVTNTGVITDDTGSILYNLFQQDMSAIRVTFRFGWALPNPTNRVNPDDDTRLPFAALTPPANT